MTHCSHVGDGWPLQAITCTGTKKKCKKSNTLPEKSK